MFQRNLHNLKAYWCSIVAISDVKNEGVPGMNRAYSVMNSLGAIDKSCSFSIPPPKLLYGGNNAFLLTFNG